MPVNVRQPHQLQYQERMTATPLAPAPATACDKCQKEQYSPIVCQSLLRVVQARKEDFVDLIKLTNRRYGQ